MQHAALLCCVWPHHCSGTWGPVGTGPTPGRWWKTTINPGLPNLSQSVHGCPICYGSSCLPLCPLETDQIHSKASGKNLGPLPLLSHCPVYWRSPLVQAEFAWWNGAGDDPKPGYVDNFCQLCCRGGNPQESGRVMRPSGQCSGSPGTCQMPHCYGNKSGGSLKH